MLWRFDETPHFPDDGAQPLTTYFPELDDGAMVTLGPGDTVVQNGTRHRWSNPGTEPATLAVVLGGAHHDVVPPHEH